MKTDLGKYVEGRLKNVFLEVAELVNEEAKSGEEVLGAPMAIFIAERYMLHAWRSYVDEGSLTIAAGAGGRIVEEANAIRTK